MSSLLPRLLNMIQKGQQEKGRVEKENKERREREKKKRQNKQETEEEEGALRGVKMIGRKKLYFCRSFPN